MKSSSQLKAALVQPWQQELIMTEIEVIIIYNLLF